MKKTLAEQVRDLENTRAAKAARMTDVLQKAADEGRSLDAAEHEECGGLKMEIKQIDEDLVFYRDGMALEASTAKEVVVDVAKSAPKAPLVFVRKADPDDKFEGQSFVRKTIASLLGQAYGANPGEIAKQLWGHTNPQLVDVIRSGSVPMFLRAGVAGIAGGSGEPGAELVQADSRYTGDFIEYLYAQTAYNKLPLRVVPALVTIKGQDGAATANWVGESKGIPMSKPDFSTVSLSYKKVAALTTASLEWMTHSDPSGEMLLRDSLVQASAQAIDTRFFSSTAGTSTVSPDGILHNVAGTTSAGTDADGVINDIKELRARFIAQNNATGLWFASASGLASSLSLMRNALGQKEFTEMNQEGGRLEGHNYVVSDNISSTRLIMLKPSDIWRIGSGNIRVAMSQDATVEQDTAPQGAQDTPTAASANMVNMFQNDSVALKVVVDIDFQKRRSHAAQFITNANYGGSIST